MHCQPSTTPIRTLALAAGIALCVATTTAHARATAITVDDAVAARFMRHTVTGITTPLPVAPDVTGMIGVSYLTITDLNDDGIKEIIATSGVGPDSDLATSNGQVAVFNWDGQDPDTWTGSIICDSFSFPNETTARDLDDDGDLDIIVADHFIANNDPGGIFYLENLGNDITSMDNWIKQCIFLDATPDSYHRVKLCDLDGDGDDDIITMNWSGWTGWLEAENDGQYTPRTIGTGGGSLFVLYDVDQDGDNDIIAPQFNITTGLFSCLVTGGPDGSDPAGDSLLWFENPGSAALSANPDLLWDRHTIDNWYTSSCPIGKGMEVVIADIDNDGSNELVVSNHNHQNHDNAANRIWPSGIYYLEIPGHGADGGDPKVAADWQPIVIETGDPDFAYANGATKRSDPYNDSAVPADPYAVDRRGSFYDQGSPGMVRAADITGDGAPELVVPGDGKGRLYYYEAGAHDDQTLRFTRATLYQDLQCMPAEAEIVDLDDDGDLDIVAAIFDTSVAKQYPYSSGSIFFYENTSATAAAVTRFKAIPGCAQVTLTWCTAIEPDTLGFNIYRAADINGPFTRVNTILIPASGDASNGACYHHTDRTADNRASYYYRLEDIGIGRAAIMHCSSAAVTPRARFWWRNWLLNRLNPK